MKFSENSVKQRKRFISILIKGTKKKTIMIMSSFSSGINRNGRKRRIRNTSMAIVDTVE